MKTAPLPLATLFTLAMPLAWAAAPSPTVPSPTMVVSASSGSTSPLSPTAISTSTISATTAVTATTPLPLLVGNGPRSLETTLSLSEKHPQLLTSQARVEEAGGSLRAARGSRWFTITGDAETGFQDLDQPGSNGTDTIGNYGLSLAQPLIDGGRRRGFVTSAEERLSGATDNLAWQQRLRRYNAAQAHIGLWLAQELANNTADNVNQLEQIVSEVQGRLNHGEATVTELAEAQSRLASAHAAQAERIAALGNAQATYLRDVGEPVLLVATPGTSAPLPANDAMVHPLVSAARHAVQEAEGVVRQRKAAYWPTLDLRSRVSRDNYAGTSRTDTVTQGQVTLNLGYTFIDNGVTSGETAAARAARRAAESDLADIELQVDAARFNAQSNLTEADRRLTESQRARTESARVINNLLQEVRQGNRTLRDLLDARRDELGAANAWAQAYANRALVTFDLERWQ